MRRVCLMLRELPSQISTEISAMISELGVKRMEFIDLSVAIEHNTPSDPPSMPTEIDYLDDVKGAQHMKGFFPGISDADLPKGLGWSLEYMKLTTHSGTHLDAP